MMSNSRFGPLWPFTAFAAALALLIACGAGMGRGPDLSARLSRRAGAAGRHGREQLPSMASPIRARTPRSSSPCCRPPPLRKWTRRWTSTRSRSRASVLDKREPMQLAIGKGFLLIGRQTADKVRYKKWLLVAGASDLTALVTVQVPEQEDKTYPDRVVRAALATLSVRAKVPEAEELGLLPFAVGDFAGFQVEDVLRGRALMLRDTPATKDSAKDAGRKRRRCAHAHRRPARRSCRAGRPREFRPADVPGNRRHPRCLGDAVGATADQRPVGIPDHGGGKGRAHRRRCARDPVAALRRRRLSADGRHRAVPTPGQAFSRACARFATASS